MKSYLMEYHQDDNQAWAWQCDDIYLQADSNIEDISYMFEETTPIKSCGDLTYHFGDCEITSKTPCKEYASQIKRRRILDFDYAGEQISCPFFKSKERIDAYDVALPELDSCLRGEFLPSNIEDFKRSEAWLAECLNDDDLNLSSDDGKAPVPSDNVEVDGKECEDVRNRTFNSGSHMVQGLVRSSRIVLKGRKSYMRTPLEAPAAIVYPFNFIKPCGVDGDVTLRDINQRIHTPPPSKPKEDSIYPISAFSGKPVIGKTKIPTQGGKGCITIMRTKG